MPAAAASPTSPARSTYHACVSPIHAVLIAQAGLLRPFVEIPLCIFRTDANFSGLICSRLHAAAATSDVHLDRHPEHFLLQIHRCRPCSRSRRPVLAYVLRCDPPSRGIDRGGHAVSHLTTTVQTRRACPYNSRLGLFDRSTHIEGSAPLIVCRMILEWSPVPATRPAIRQGSQRQQRYAPPPPRRTSPSFAHFPLT